jgi:hypothetical protein
MAALNQVVAKGLGTIQSFQGLAVLLNGRAAFRFFSCQSFEPNTCGGIGRIRCDFTALAWVTPFCVCAFDQIFF